MPDLRTHLHANGSVRRATGFVLTGNPDIGKVAEIRGKEVKLGS